MTIVTLRDEATKIQELSADQLNQVTGGNGHDGNTALPAFMLIAAAAGIVGTIIAGIIGHFTRGE